MQPHLSVFLGLSTVILPTKGYPQHVVVASIAYTLQVDYVYV